MSKKMIVMIIAAALVVVGGAVTLVSIRAFGDKERAMLKTEELTVNEKINAIRIDSAIGDIKLIAVSGGDVRVRYTSGAKIACTAEVQNGVLSITNSINNDKRKWYDNFMSIPFGGDYNIFVEVPMNLKAETDIKSDYGNVEVTGINGSINLNSACGDIEIKNGEFGNIVCKADYGDIDIENCKADSIRVENSCGDIDIKDTTGDLDADLSMGDIEISRIISDNISLQNNCGDIEGTILGSEADYSINAGTSAGDCNLMNRTGGKKKLSAFSDLGDVNIKFMR